MFRRFRPGVQWTGDKKNGLWTYTPSISPRKVSQMDAAGIKLEQELSNVMEPLIWAPKVSSDNIAFFVNDLPATPTETFDIYAQLLFLASVADPNTNALTVVNADPKEVRHVIVSQGHESRLVDRETGNVATLQGLKPAPRLSRSGHLALIALGKNLTRHLLPEYPTLLMRTVQTYLRKAGPVGPRKTVHVREAHLLDTSQVAVFTVWDYFHSTVHTHAIVPCEGQFFL
jgi:hypothetical protein